jgi:hypothetical protein
MVVAPQCATQSGANMPASAEMLSKQGEGVYATPVKSFGRFRNAGRAMLLRCQEYSDTALEFAPSPVGGWRGAPGEGTQASCVTDCAMPIETTFSQRQTVRKQEIE